MVKPTPNPPLPSRLDLNRPPPNGPGAPMIPPRCIPNQSSILIVFAPTATKALDGLVGVNACKFNVVFE